MMIWSYGRLETTRILRDPGYLVMSVISPLTMYLVFTNLDLSGTGRGGDLYSMVGMAGFGAVGAVMTNGVAIAEDKPLGWIRQLRLLPMRPTDAVLGRALCAMALAVPPIVAVCGAAALINGVSLSPGRWAAVLALLWSGIAPMAVLGTGVGYLLSAQQAQLAGLTCYLGLSLLGGLWFPVAKFPAWLAVVAESTPVNRYGQLSWQVIGGHAPSLGAIAVLAAWAALFVALSTYAYRRSARAW
jgi:ABC-2 type transport system permease protein